MTVKDLIKKLEKFDEELEVFRYECERGYERIFCAEKKNIFYREEGEFFQGHFLLAQGDDKEKEKKKFPAILIY